MGSHRDIWRIIMSRIGRLRFKIRDNGRVRGVGVSSGLCLWAVYFF